MSMTMASLMLCSLLATFVLVVADNTASYVPGRAFNRFITIWLENQDYDKVLLDSSIQQLLPHSISLSSYYGLTHPSQPNYLASIAGDYFGLNHDQFVTLPPNSGPSVGSTSNTASPEVQTLVDLLEEAKIEWKGYFEGMPGPGYLAEGSTMGWEERDGEGVDGEKGRGLWDYVRKHNPFASFNSIAHDGSRLYRTQSLGAFHRDLKAQSLPQYMHISPDMLNDGHNTTLAFAATWSLKFVTDLLSNEYLMKDTLILLTYDESETYSKPNHIVSLLLGGAIPEALKGTSDETFYTHYSILSTLQNNWELPNLGRYDVGANVFDFVAKKTGYKGNALLGPMQWANVDLSVSNGGILHNDPNMQRPIPPPNLGLVGAGGKGVAQSVKTAWDAEKDSPTPYDGRGKVWEAVVYGGQGPPS